MNDFGKAFMHRTSYMNDFFETPYSMTEQLLEKLKEYNIILTDNILEPACGKNAITKVLLASGIKNIIYYDYIKRLMTYEKKNFYKEQNKYDWIITNPPYNQADLFVKKAKSISKKGFIFLLRTNYLSGCKRYNAQIYSGLKHVFIFTRMSDLRCPIREDGKYETAGIVYAWCIWINGYKNKPMIDWINNQKYVLRKGD